MVRIHPKTGTPSPPVAPAEACGLLVLLWPGCHLDAEHGDVGYVYSDRGARDRGEEPVATVRRVEDMR